jgi:hypothetical protein
VGAGRIADAGVGCGGKEVGIPLVEPPEELDAPEEFDVPEELEAPKELELPP